MRKKMLVADLLCGAGGSSTGCARALRELGLEMDLVCLNHWPTAIETHRRNHPEARHYVQDIATVRPHLLVPEGYLDLLMASPTCTHHSVARGGKPTSDQQRSDPWHIITWLTELRVRRIIIENVWEFIGWGPVDHRTGKPVKSRKGEYFNAWIDTIKRLGFDPEWRKLNAANYGDATTRQRFILKARSDRTAVGWAPLTHGKRRDDELDLSGLRPWKPAREIIDWSLKGRSIYGRKKPLAAKTLARIYAGVVKHGWPQPYIVTLRNHMAAQGIDMPLPTIAANGTHIGLAQPVLLRTDMHPGGGNSDVVEPFVLSTASGGSPRSVEKPIPTSTAGGNGAAHALIAPYYGSGSGETCSSTDEPLPAATAKARFGMVVPITHSDGGNRARDVNVDGLPTITGANRGELAFITAQHGERQGQAPRVHSVDDPAPTVAATGHIDLVEGAPQFDILFRMLEPHELAAAMGFNSDDEAYDFAGTKTEKIKQIGNAVSVSMMKDEVRAFFADAVKPRAANDNAASSEALDAA
jgi:DNA (cytosine-5)-methyltransferase 1